MREYYITGADGRRKRMYGWKGRQPKLVRCTYCDRRHRLSAMETARRDRENGYDSVAICPKTGQDIWLMSIGTVRI